MTHIYTTQVKLPTIILYELKLENRQIHNVARWVAEIACPKITSAFSPTEQAKGLKKISCPTATINCD